MSGSYPATRDAREYLESTTAYDRTMEVDGQVREYLIAVEQVKIMQQKLKACYMRSGPNHFEDCKELRDTLWEKLNTHNYGAPGPERSVRFCTARWANTARSAPRPAPQPPPQHDAPAVSSCPAAAERQVQDQRSKNTGGVILTTYAVDGRAHSYYSACALCMRMRGPTMGIRFRAVRHGIQ